jgi:NAD(P)-dependent dehydrogenase (short-subunit alcohol dehydrogenase family)
MTKQQRNVLITGTSSGIGQAAAVEFARRGWQVYASLRDTSRSDEIFAAAGDKAASIHPVQLDLCSASSVSRAVDDVLSETGGKIDVLVNNAGVGDNGFFEEQPEADFRQVVETNLFGTCALTRQVVPAMRARQAGRIITVTSVAAYVAFPSLSAYVASKRALQGWLEVLAVELKPFGIGIAIVEPGTYKTSIWSNATWFSDPGSVYAPMAKQIREVSAQLVEKSGRDPREAGAKIVRIAEGRGLPFRTPVGRDARFLYRTMGAMPFRLRARLIAAATGVGK